MKRLLFFLLLSALPLYSQVDAGELRLRVSAPSGVPVKSVVELVCAGNGFHKSLETDDSGAVSVKGIPYGVYQVQVEQPGFAPFSGSVEIRSALPVEEVVHLSLASLITNVTVVGDGTLIDPNRPGSVMQIGTPQIEQRVSSLPGRSVQDLVNSQPGWLYEGNAVLHPRGSESQVQFVLDGIPLTDNRSPGEGPEIEAEDLDSMKIYTAGLPAEYGRKMGGVVELNTRHQTEEGVHGQLVLSVGSDDSASSYGRLQDTWGKNTLGASATGSMTSHYLNPVVPQNFSNRGTSGDFSVRYERDLNDANRLTLSVRHELARYLIPNEFVQEQAGQVQNGDNFETIGWLSYQHIFSAEGLASLSVMARDKADDLYSNERSTPIVAFQNNDFREIYAKGTVSLHHGMHELKGGLEADSSFLHEGFRYLITDPTQFAADTPSTLSFAGDRPDLEQSGFIEDRFGLGKWTVAAGLRWDHYQLLLNQNAVSPRISIGRYLPSHNTVLHISYDRVFQTPAFENILISSSPQVDALSSQFLRLPVHPSQGNYYETGASKAFRDRVRMDVNLYRRDVTDFADDDQLLNTGVSYPIAFDKSVIYGAEGKLDFARMGRVGGFLSYSYMVGNVWLPVTGGLFLGNDVTTAVSEMRGHLPASQDQRNTVRTRFTYRLAQRLDLAAGAVYGSGLPFAFTGDRADALTQYGPAVISRINFDRGRILPSFAMNASIGATVYKSRRGEMRFQVDGDNLNGRFNVIDFGGLFSGNAIAPGRTFAVRLTNSF
jgi:hypothetical protein